MKDARTRAITILSGPSSVRPDDQLSGDASPRVIVLRTDVHDRSAAEDLRAALDDRLMPDHPWNFDLEDRDRILRVEAPGSMTLPIARLLNAHGHACEPLDDPAFSAGGSSN